MSRYGRKGRCSFAFIEKSFCLWSSLGGRTKISNVNSVILITKIVILVLILELFINSRDWTNQEKIFDFLKKMTRNKLPGKKKDNKYCPFFPRINYSFSWKMECFLIRSYHARRDSLIIIKLIRSIRVNLQNSLKTENCEFGS